MFVFFCFFSVEYLRKKGGNSASLQELEITHSQSKPALLDPLTLPDAAVAIFSLI